jgi:hypothetical protein
MFALKHVERHEVSPICVLCIHVRELVFKKPNDQPIFTRHFYKATGTNRMLRFRTYTFSHDASSLGDSKWKADDCLNACIPLSANVIFSFVPDYILQLTKSVLIKSLSVNLI